MDIVFSERHRGHDPQSFIVRGRFAEAAETPRRGDILSAAAVEAGFNLVEPADHGLAPLARIHSPEYLEFLSTGHERWREIPGAGPEIIANAHPGRHMAARPQGIVGQAGYHMADGACPIGAGTWDAAQAAADVALSAADLLLDGAPAAYALCRPPGHHAFADMAGGFCFLNNVAIAAQHLLPRFGRAAIVDFDVHHGNGTQGIFYGRDDVFFASIHADPATYYPWFAGYAGERGAGRGLGYNLNLPLAPGTGDAAFVAGIETLLEAIARFDPNVLLVSAGFDAQEHDPLGVFKVTTDGFLRVGEVIGAFARARELPSLMVQEGGYVCDDLGRNLVAFLKGFEG
jgi:acetoin utilization deacetylase AcuC-like enzyme